jgi:hypothetical protein
MRSGGTFQKGVGRIPWRHAWRDGNDQQPKARLVARPSSRAFTSPSWSGLAGAGWLP